MLSHTDIQQVRTELVGKCGYDYNVQVCAEMLLVFKVKCHYALMYSQSIIKNYKTYSALSQEPVFNLLIVAFKVSEHRFCALQLVMLLRMC